MANMSDFIKANKTMNERGAAPLFTLSLEEIEPVFKAWVTEALADALPSKERQDIFYTREQVCKLLNISRSSLTNYLKAGEIQGQKIGGKLIFYRDDVLKAVKGRAAE